MQARRTTLIAIVIMAITFSCQKDLSNQATLHQEANKKQPSEAAAEGASTRTICFTAIAVLNACIGENIIFGGTLEIKENTTVDQQGRTHYTRQWSVKNATGKGIFAGGGVNQASALCPRPTNGTTTGTSYEVIAGHEMFSVHTSVPNPSLPGLPLNSDIYIHQGTVVFVNTATGEKIVARHEILKVPGQEGVFRSVWRVKGMDCH